MRAEEPGFGRTALLREALALISGVAARWAWVRAAALPAIRTPIALPAGNFGQREQASGR
jgi:hypothetical protein